jgi:hypothetical protein
MICVLQISGYELEAGIARHFAMSSYRKERSPDNHEIIYYDVADANDKNEFAEGIRRFLDENRPAFAYAMENPQSVKIVNLDVGIIIGTAFSFSVPFDKALLATIGQLGLSLSISVYRGQI